MISKWTSWCNFWECTMMIYRKWSECQSHHETPYRQCITEMGESAKNRRSKELKSSAFSKSHHHHESSKYGDDQCTSRYVNWVLFSYCFWLVVITKRKSCHRVVAALLSAGINLEFRKHNPLKAEVSCTGNGSGSFIDEQPITNCNIFTKIDLVTDKLSECELRVKSLEHEIGECKVEWASCEQLSRQKDKLNTKRIDEIEIHKHRYSACLKRLNSCKNARAQSEWAKLYHFAFPPNS